MMPPITVLGFVNERVEFCESVSIIDAIEFTIDIIPVEWAWNLYISFILKFDPNSILVVNFILTGNKHILIINSYINEYICYTLQVKKLIKNILKLLKKKKKLLKIYDYFKSIIR